jgi:hypothetical protein
VHRSNGKFEQLIERKEFIGMANRIIGFPCPHMSAHFCLGSVFSPLLDQSKYPRLSTFCKSMGDSIEISFEFGVCVFVLFISLFIITNNFGGNYSEMITCLKLKFHNVIPVIGNLFFLVASIRAKAVNYIRSESE